MASEGKSTVSLPHATLIPPPSSLFECSPSSSHSSASDRIDELLKQYLNHLDTYQTAQAKFCERLSSVSLIVNELSNIQDTVSRQATLLTFVFLSLARANYASSPRQRYGSDFYDLGMKASLRIVVNPEAEKQLFRIAIVDPTSLTEDVRPHKACETAIATDQPLPSSTLLSTHSQLSPSSSANGVDEIRKRKKGNPLHWFGILVPQQLRDAEATSRLGIEEAIPDMAGMATELRRLEDEIKRLRKIDCEA